MNEQLLIFGTGAYAEQVHHYFARGGRYRRFAFTVDAEHLQADRFCGEPALAFAEAVAACPPARWDLFVAIGYTGINEARKLKYEAAKASGYTLASYVHATAIVADGTEVQDNSFLAERVLVKPFARLGRDVQIGSNVYIGHGARVGDHGYLAAGALLCGMVELGERCFVGANATVRDKVKVGPRCVIGVGAVVHGDCAADGVYKAAPAQRHPLGSGTLRRL